MSIMDTVVATGKVFYDKSYDYLRYCFTSSEENNENSEDSEESIDIDNINKLLKIEKDEPESIRIYPEVSFFDEWSTFFTEPSHIIDNIYLGSAHNAASYETLKVKDIRIIINVTKELTDWYDDDAELTYIKFPIYDNNSDSIKKHLDDIYDTIIDKQKETEGNILIHCFMGRSRSACVVIYYMMRKYNHTFAEALDYVKTLRPVVNPTYRFAKDLMTIS
jgi:hypothetical protein